MVTLMVLLASLRLGSSVRLGGVFLTEEKYQLLAFAQAHEALGRGVLEEPYVLKLRYADPLVLLRAACELANANVSGVVVGGSAAVAEGLAPMAAQLRLPLIRAETRPLDVRVGRAGRAFVHSAYPRRSHLAALTAALHAEGWGRFYTLYDSEAALEDLMPALEELVDANSDLDGDKISSQAPEPGEEGPERLRLVRVREGEELAAARRLVDFATCLKAKRCSRLRILLHLSDRLLQSTFVALLRCGLVRHDVEMSVTSGSLDQLNLSWINQNMLKVTGMVPKDGDRATGDVVEAVRLAYATDRTDDYFPRAEVLAVSRAVHGFARALKVLKSSPRRPSQKLATLDRRLRAQCSPRPTDLARQTLPISVTPSRWGAKLEKHLGLEFQGRDEHQGFWRKELGPDGELRSMGSWAGGTEEVNASAVAKARRQGVETKRFHLRVVSIEERPYLILHRHRHSVEPKGFCVDLLRRLSRDLGFTFDLHVVGDGRYGSPNASDGRWDGMVGEILEGKADLAIAPLTINYERAQVVDFTAPFLQHGVAMLLRVPTSQLPSFVAFLSPLSRDLWLGILAAFLATVGVTFFVVSISPLERSDAGALTKELLPEPSGDLDRKLSSGQVFNVMKSINRANLAALNKYDGRARRSSGSRSWHFPWSILMNSTWYITCILFMTGCDFGPKAVSTRFLSGIFWIFCLVMGATYTAEFASVLTVDMRTLPVTSFDQLANQTEYAFGALRGGSTLQFLKESEFGSFHRLHRRLTLEPGLLADNNAEAVERVLASKYIYLMESTSIQYEVRQNCNLTQVSNVVLGSRGYGIALRKNSPWTDKISQRVMWYADEGFIEHTKRMWWRSATFCDRNSASVKNIPQALEMRHVVGLFLILVSGLAFASLVTVAEVAFARWRRRGGRPEGPEGRSVKFGHQLSSSSDSSRRKVSVPVGGRFSAFARRRASSADCADCDASRAQGPRQHSFSSPSPKPFTGPLPPVPPAYL